MKPAVIYARYSSHTQTEQSIEAQLRICHEYARREGYNVIFEYIDRAKSGTKDNRPEFQHMISDSTDHNFKFVIVYQFDRFARNRRDSINYKFYLRKNGVRVISATEPSEDTPESVMIEGMLENIAEYYSLDLSRKAKRGIMQSVLNKKAIGGRMLYGYKTVDKKILIDEEKAKHIRYYFEQRAKGRRRNDVIEELRAKGICGINGKLLDYKSFQNAEHNRKYIGEFNFHGEIYYEIYPPIIEKEIFMKVQNLPKKPRPANHSTVDYLLSSRAFCGYCGSSIVGISGTSKQGTKHHYYVCSKQYKEHACKKLSENKELLEKFICEQTLKYIGDPAKADYIADRMMEVINSDQGAKDIEFYNKEIARINHELDKLSDEYIGAPQAVKDRLTEKINILSIQLQDIKDNLEKAQAKQKIKMTKEGILEWLGLLCSGNVEDEKFRDNLITNFINSLYIFDDKMIIYYNVKDEKTVCHKAMLEDLEQLKDTKKEPSEEGSYRTENGGATGI